MAVKHPSNSTGSALAQLGCLGVMLLGWAFFATLPYSLYFVLVIAVLVASLSVWKRRKTVVAVFQDKDTSPALGAVRQKSVILLVAVAVIATYISVSLVGSPSLLFSCLISAVLWTVVLHLGALEYGRSRNRQRLPYLLLTNGREFSLTVDIVLAAYILISLRMQTVALDDITVLKLMDWENRILKVHVFLEALKFSLLQLLGLLFGFWFLRICESFFVGSTTASDRTWSLVLRSMRWAERFSLIFLIAASITFLGTKSDGQVARISAQIRGSKDQYNELQRLIREHGELAVRKQLLIHAWGERPQMLTEMMERSQKLIQSRRDLENLSMEASDRYKIKIALPETTPLTRLPNQHGLQEDNVQINVRELGVLSSRQISSLLEVAKQLDSGTSPKKETEGPRDELLKKTLEELLPAERLTDHVSSLAALSQSYPVFGEFLNTVASAFVDAAFQRLKDLAIQKISTPNVLATKDSLQHGIDDTAADITSRVQFDWSLFSKTWKDRTERKIANRQSAITQANARLVREALHVRDKQVAGVVSAISAGHLILVELSAGLADNSLATKAFLIDKTLRELVRESRSWPALGHVPPSQEQALQKTMQDSSHIFAADDSAAALEFLFSSRDPLGALKLLSGHSNDLIVETVQRSAASPELTRAVRRVLGSRFDFYDGVWKAREEARRQEKARLARQEEARRQAGLDRMRREQEQMRELEDIRRGREYEHPEIP